MEAIDQLAEVCYLAVAATNAAKRVAQDSRLSLRESSATSRNLVDEWTSFSHGEENSHATFAEQKATMAERKATLHNDRSDCTI